MFWEIIALGVLFLLITGTALWNMQKKKRSEFASFGNNKDIDISALASQVTKVLTAEMKIILAEFKDEITKELKTMRVTGSAQGVHKSTPGGIEMDESVIPTNLKVSVQGTNLDKAGLEQKVIDKGLDESKSRLAGLFKNKKKE